MTELEHGQVVMLELSATNARIAAWTVQIVDAHLWLELHVPARVVVGERVKLIGVGGDGAAWCLDSRVVEVRDPDRRGIPLVKVEDNGARVAMQRREYFRVPATLPVVLAVPARATGELVAVTTVDLSGGGVQVETEYALVVGDAVELSLALPARMIHVTGFVTRVAAADPTSPLRVPGRDPTWLVGIELGAMMERDRSELVRFVHDVERKLRAVRAG